MLEVTLADIGMAPEDQLEQDGDPGLVHGLDLVRVAPPSARNGLVV